jgi:hypothetical protein
MYQVDSVSPHPKNNNNNNNNNNCFIVCLPLAMVHSVLCWWCGCCVGWYWLVPLSKGFKCKYYCYKLMYNKQPPMLTCKPVIMGLWDWNMWGIFYLVSKVFNYVGYFINNAQVGNTADKMTQQQWDSRQLQFRAWERSALILFHL